MSDDVKTTEEASPTRKRILAHLEKVVSLGAVAGAALAVTACPVVMDPAPDDDDSAMDDDDSAVDDDDDSA
jgi:hypothetical protein